MKTSAPVLVVLILVLLVINILSGIANVRLRNALEDNVAVLVKLTGSLEACNAALEVFAPGRRAE